MMATKEEVKIDMNEVLTSLLLKITELENKVDKQNAKVAADEPSNIRRPDHPEAGGGWVVSTPRQDYIGTTMHIEFRAGIGIVDEDLDNADFIANKLEHDFGYGVKAVSPDELGKFRKYMAGVNTKETRTMGEKLVSPGYR